MIKRIVLVFALLLCVCNVYAEDVAVRENKSVVAIDENGKLPFYQIGLNLGWGVGNAIDQHRVWFNRMEVYGFNWARVWSCSWWVSLSDDVGVIKFKRLLDSAKKRNIKIQLVLENALDLSENWAKTPYAKMGFSLQEFFVKEEAWEAYEKHLNKIVDAFSEHPALGMWEICNEIDLVKIDGEGVSPEILTAWAKRVFEYIKARDKTGRLITVSVSMYDERWKTLIDAVDTHSIHTYIEEDSFVENNAGRFEVEYFRDCGNLVNSTKPVFWDEVGIHGTNVSRLTMLDEKGVHLHNALWASLFSNTSGLCMPWWWDSYIMPKSKLKLWTPIVAFLNLAGTPLENPQWKQSTLTEKDARVFTLMDNTSGIGWVLRDGAQWFARVVEKREERDAKSIKIHLENITSEVIEIKWFDTWTGKIIHVENHNVKNGSVVLSSPMVVHDIAFWYKAKDMKK